MMGLPGTGTFLPLGLQTAWAWQGLAADCLCGPVTGPRGVFQALPAPRGWPTGVPPCHLPRVLAGRAQPGPGSVTRRHAQGCCTLEVIYQQETHTSKYPVFLIFLGTHSLGSELRLNQQTPLFTCRGSSLLLEIVGEGRCQCSRGAECGPVRMAS